MANKGIWADEHDLDFISEDGNVERDEVEEEGVWTNRSVAHMENALLTVLVHSSKQGILPVWAYVIESA